MQKDVRNWRLIRFPSKSRVLDNSAEVSIQRFCVDPFVFLLFVTKLRNGHDIPDVPIRVASIQSLKPSLFPKQDMTHPLQQILVSRESAGNEVDPSFICPRAMAYEFGQRSHTAFV